MKKWLGKFKLTEGIMGIQDAFIVNTGLVRLWDAAVRIQH